MVTDPPTHKHTHRQDRLQYTTSLLASAQCNEIKKVLFVSAEDAASPRASQCSHTESLICGITSPDDAATSEVAAGPVQSEASTAPRCHGLAAADGQDAAGSDVSEPYDGEEDIYDLEVNFESEADMLAVEMSGDELDRGGIAASHDFSELSSQVTTDRGSSDDDDDDDDVSDDPFSRQHLLGFFTAGTNGGSEGDLSWDASAEMPSFVVPSSPANVQLNFPKR